MGKRGPKEGESKWRWHYIKRVRDGKYYVGVYRSGSRPSYRFGKRADAPAWRLKEAFSMLCRIRRHYRKQERTLRKRAAPETFVLEVQNEPRAKINYPWPMPM